MPNNEEKLTLDDLELTTEEMDQVQGGAERKILRPGIKIPGLVNGPRPDQSLVFGPRPDQTPVFDSGVLVNPITNLDLTAIFTR